MNRIRFALFVSCVWLTTITCTWAQTEVIYFEAPGSGQGQNQGTVGVYIGPDSSIVGSFYDSNSVGHGYVRHRNGTFARFDPSGSAGTYPLGINSSDVIVGRYDDASGIMHGFIRSATGKITIYNAPGAGLSSGQGTVLGSINTSGEILGDYVDAN